MEPLKRTRRRRADRSFRSALLASLGLHGILVVALVTTEWELPEVGARNRTASAASDLMRRVELPVPVEELEPLESPYADAEPELFLRETVRDRAEEVFEESDLWPSFPKTDHLAAAVELDPPLPIDPTVEPEGEPEEDPTQVEAPASAEAISAVPLDNPPPEYPRASRRLGEEGVVLLRITIDAEGAVVRVELATSSGHDRLDRAALEAVRRWRFEPARRDGRAVEAVLEHEVVFQLS